MHSVCIELVYIATCTLVILDNLFVIYLLFLYFILLVLTWVKDSPRQKSEK